MGGHGIVIKGNCERMTQMKRHMGLALLALTLAAPALAQSAPRGSDGDAFLTALREGNGSKAVNLAEGKGSTVINYHGDDGETALHVVIHTRNSNWVGFLLANGADPDAVDKKGETPLLVAIRTNNIDAAAQLLRGRAQVDKPNRKGETPLIVAVQQRNALMVSTLLKIGANPDRADYAAGYSARDYAKRDSRSRDMLRLIETVKSRLPPKPAR